MKRFFVSLALVLLVVWAVKSHHPRPVGPVGTPAPPWLRHGPRPPHVGPGRDLAWQTRPAPAVIPAREQADGLPVPIVPGTRVTEAEVRPPAPPVPPRHVVAIRNGQAPRDIPPTPPAARPSTIVVKGQISATQERAEADARNALREKAADWLAPDVPRTWKIPAPLLQSLIVETRYTPEEKPYGTLYWGELTVNFSPDRRARLVEVYTRELTQHRLMSLGGALVFVLIGLAAVSSYIRADEATKGYYTNRLRMLAAAGVGAAGVILYRMVA